MFIRIKWLGPEGTEEAIVSDINAAHTICDALDKLHYVKFWKVEVPLDLPWYKESLWNKCRDNENSWYDK